MAMNDKKKKKNQILGPLPNRAKLKNNNLEGYLIYLTQHYLHLREHSPSHYLNNVSPTSQLLSYQRMFAG